MKLRKRFGQHFLEPAWVRKLLDVVAPKLDDVFLEIGPGRGALTLPLAPLVRQIVAVEIDRDLAARLQRIVPGNVRIVTADFLRTDLHALLADRFDSTSRVARDSAPILESTGSVDSLGAPDPDPGARRDPDARPDSVRVVGNLPYNISSPILFRLLSAADDGRFLSDATLMLQREVADRIVAAPNTADYGVLSILVRFHSLPFLGLLLPPGAFRPPPRVSSAVVRLAFTPPTVPTEDPALLEQMVRTMFTHRRKTLTNSLREFAEAHDVQAGEELAKAGIDGSRRPETLDLPEIARLADVFASASRPDVL